MSKLLGLSEMKSNTQFAPLVGLGYYFQKQDYYSALRGIDLKIKTVDHKPHEKLIDIIVSVLAGCTSISQINTRLRPDRALARGWGREQFSEQSNIANTLNAFDDESIGQLRAATESIYLKEGRAIKHDYDQELLTLDLDLTGLLASKESEGSTKGYFSGKKTHMDAN
ncbi:MAG: hypothetical protein QF858_00090 [Candidatus Pacebacteria bacterium]|jgi:hypothetical protein|nr:hypothetical protein [Candidatus Paceibacterota bacterium]|tara:strand:+ start:240 stop:743 length:504 start_codon:yes stop_codon:yes gene_type:complete